MLNKQRGVIRGISRDLAHTENVTVREIIKPSYITPTSIWIVATGEGWAGTRSALGAYVSTDLTEKESSDHLRSFGGRIGRDVHSLLANFESFNDPDVVCGLLDELDGRFLVGLYDRRPPITRLVSTLVFDPASSAFMDQTIFDGMRDRFRSALDLRAQQAFARSIRRDPRRPVGRVCGTRRLVGNGVTAGLLHRIEGSPRQD